MEVILGGRFGDYLIRFNYGFISKPNKINMIKIIESARVLRN